MRCGRPPDAASSWYLETSRGDGVGQLLGERGAVGGRGEAHLAVDCERGDPLAAPSPLRMMSAPTSCTSLAATASSHRADSRSGERAGSGCTAARASGEMT